MGNGKTQGSAARKATLEAGEGQPVRFVSAASLFDGHDAAINMIRRLLQAHGAEVVHLGHNRSVADIVRAAIQEDADAIACSSYQGGHNEYFRYMVDMLAQAGASHIRVIVGGGGTIAPHEIDELHAYGVERIYSPEDGRTLGLDGMMDDVFQRVRGVPRTPYAFGPMGPRDHLQIARAISSLERDEESGALRDTLRKAVTRVARPAPVIGITGTGGAGKSSLTDELLMRFVRFHPGRNIGVIAMDPTRRRSGGALLGDRIRMNSLANEQIFMRSLATRRRNLATSAVLADTINLLKCAGFDLIVVETAGIGQSDTEIVDLVDVPVYVMTSEYGAASQLEKIDMLDFAELIALNKFEKRGAEDALRDVRKQWRRNHPTMKRPDAEIPVFPTIASRFNDPGVNRLFDALTRLLDSKAGGEPRWTVTDPGPMQLIERHALVPTQRTRYLAEIAANGRRAREDLQHRAEAASRANSLHEALRVLGDPLLPAALERYADAALADASEPARARLRDAYNDALDAVGAEAIELLKQWPTVSKSATDDEYRYVVRGREIRGENYTETLSRNRVPKLAVPSWRDWGDQLTFLLRENLPGHFPYTAGVYPYRREEEDPTRMFAGEGGPERTNRRFHYVASGHGAARLSTAFDSTTLYGEDPDERPDIYGRIGNSGVSIASLDDMKKLYSGFDLCDPTTSVSMTINGPAPMILAMFMNTAIDQRVERHLRSSGGWEAAERKIAELYRDHERPRYKGELPVHHDGSGLGLLGVTGDQLLDRGAYEKIRAEALSMVRGTVQADILKEDQAQNTCIFSTEFALRMMGDVQQYFIEKNVRNFYSVSVSGYHIAEAGANPITQLAFTLANGFTYLEHYLARGMQIDQFAPNFSFFFSNGLDAEYHVIGRVARRIWAIALRDHYGAAERSQKLKYHVQTSGRSLHAQEMAFNDIRTTLQALSALFDHCNSLHTNAYDEAVTTPTEESVRRAVAIQLVIQRELGLSQNENPIQGSYVIEQLTDEVEEAVLCEFERLSQRGGVLGAMETLYQRSKIQEESLHYESLKHSGQLPIVGVNFFENPDAQAASARPSEVARAHDGEKRAQLLNLQAFQARSGDRCIAAIAELQQTARRGGDVFDALMETVKHASLGQITHALFEVGGAYRRAM